MIFNVSLRFCQGDHVGIYVPSLEGLTGIGYRVASILAGFRVYAEQTLSTPPSLNQTNMYEFRFQAVPLVSVEG